MACGCSWFSSGPGAGRKGSGGAFETAAPVLQALGGFSLSTVAAQHEGLHPGQTAAIIVDGKTIGYIGSLHPKLIQYWDFETAPVLFEIEVAQLPQERLPKFRPLSKFPSVRRDISLVVGVEIGAESVLESARAGGGELLCPKGLLTLGTHLFSRPLFLAGHRTAASASRSAVRSSSSS